MPESTIKKANLLAKAACIQEGFKNFPSVLEQTGLLIIGSTGSGKSTLANYLLETPLIRWDDEVWDAPVTPGFEDKYKKRLHGHLYPAVSHEDRVDLPQIGTGSSTTKYITSYAASGTLLLDTPGFNDMDLNRRLANALMLERMIHQSEKVKLAIVIEYGSIEAGRSEAFKVLVKLLGELLNPDDLNQAIDLNNVLFLFTDKAGRIFRPSTIRRSTQSVKGSLELEKTSVRSQDELDLVDLGIKVCEAIIRTPDTHLIFVNPMDNGESRQCVRQAADTISSVDMALFNFDTFERIKFRDELKEDFIIRYLSLMRCESVCYELKNLNEVYHQKLLTYTQLATDEDRRKKIQQDLEKENKNLSDSESELSVLKQKLSEAEKQLNNLKPEEEVDFLIMSGDQYSYTTFVAAGTAGIASVAGIAVGSVMGLAGAFVAAIRDITGQDVPHLIYPRVYVNKVISASAKLALAPAFAVIFAAFGAYKVFSYVKEGILDYTVFFDHAYEGECFTRVEIENVLTREMDTIYYEIDPDTIIISPDNRQCTAKFQRKRGESQHTQVLHIIGKRENHPELAPIITAVKNEINRLKTEITKCENRIAMVNKIINILSILVENDDDVTLNNLIMQFTATDDKTNDINWTQSLQALIDVRKELDAVNTILTYIPVPGILSDYQDEYKALRKRNPIFKEQDCKKPAAEATEEAETPLTPFFTTGSGQTLFDRPLISPLESSPTPASTAAVAVASSPALLPLGAHK